MKWIHGIQCWKHLNPDLQHACVTESFGPQLQLQLQLHNCTWCCTTATDVHTNAQTKYHLVIGVLEYLRGAIYRDRYTASRAALGVLKILRSAIYRGRYAASRTPLPCNTLQVSFDAKILHTLISPPHIFIQHKKISQNIGHMSNPPPATPDNLPTNGLDTILYHSAYLTTPNPWGGVRRSWKETEALTNVEIV